MGISPKPIVRPQGAHESIGGQVGGVLVVPHEPVDQVEDLLLIGLEELIEGLGHRMAAVLAVLDWTIVH